MAIRNYTKSTKKATEINYKVIKKFGTLGNTDGKYVKELRLVSWNDGDPMYDIRTWYTDKDGVEKCGKGITFKADELIDLLKLLKQMDDGEDDGNDDIDANDVDEFADDIDDIDCEEE